MKHGEIFQPQIQIGHPEDNCDNFSDFSKNTCCDLSLELSQGDCSNERSTFSWRNIEIIPKLPRTPLLIWSTAFTKAYVYQMAVL